MSTDIVAVKDEIGKMLKSNLTAIQSVLPKGMDAGRFCRIALNAISKNPDLANCKPATFVLAVLNCAELGLEPILGQVALIPYNGYVQMQPMVGGLVELARRSGQISTIYAEVVKDGDMFEYEMGLNPVLKHVPRGKGELTHVYAVAKMKDSGTQFVVLTKEDVSKVRKVAKSQNIWNSWEEEMWKKTALKRLIKLLPKSTEMTLAVEKDDKAQMGDKQTPSKIDLTTLIDIPAEEVTGVSEKTDKPTGSLKKPQAAKKTPETTATNATGGNEARGSNNNDDLPFE